MRADGDARVAISRALSGRGPDLLFILLASVGIAALALALPLALLQVYDRIIPNQSGSTTGLLVMGVFFAIALEAILRSARSYLTARVSSQFDHRLHAAALRHMLRSDVGVFEGLGTGEHSERLNAIGQIRDFYAGQTLLTLLDLVLAAVYLATIYILGGSLVNVPLIAIAALAFVMLVMGRDLRRSLEKQHRDEDQHGNFVIRALTGVRTFKALAAEQLLLRRYDDLQTKRTMSTLDAERRTAALSEISGTLTQAAVVGVVCLGSLRVIDGLLTVGGLAACTLLVGRTLQPLQSALSFWTRFQTFAIAKKRVQDIFAMPVSPDAEASGAEEFAITGDIELRGVCYRYADERPWVLRDVSLQVKPGEAVAITGVNGSGKTTLLSLVRGLLQPTRGDVLIDGRNLTNIAPAQLREAVTILPQREALFHGTILDNITMYRTELESAAFKAAEFLGFADQVNGFPEGFRTVVGEDAGLQISRGLSQRITIARALVLKPRVLLFDDANSAVDIASDDFLKEALTQLKGSCTAIIVSHRPSILRVADRILDLRDGELEREGFAVEELMSVAS
ncbi:MAG: ABC transporter transmembrane domain-containing protein [Pseudomonadota bacterium]